MKKYVITVVLMLAIAVPVQALEFTAPSAPASADAYMPETVDSFADDLWYVIKQAIASALPKVSEASSICVSLIAIVLLMAILQNFSGMTGRVVNLVSVITVASLLIRPADSLIQLGVRTVEELCEYGKLFFPVMTAALAAQGGATASAALYAGTLAFNTFLSHIITKCIVPIIFFFIIVCIACCAIKEGVLVKIKQFLKWFLTWSMKCVIYLFTAYLGITGVVSGTTDAAALKAAKLTLSGVVPVVGNMISDASEAILVSAGFMKNAAGVYGLIAIIAIWIGPFIQIGIQYLLLKATGAVCAAFEAKEAVCLVNDFSSAMGFLLAMTGTCCLLLLISTVCFMRGVM